MRKSLMIVLTVGALACVASVAAAKEFRIALSDAQFSSVCGNPVGCAKSCAQYQCNFGCDDQGCYGKCTNCPTRQIGIRSIRTAIRAGALSPR